jgi:hypothetical protein
MQRRVWVESANGVIYPNLYVLLVAPPGIGKSEAIRRTGDLWRKTENLHVAANSVTRAALLDILARSTVKSTLPDGSFQLFHGLNVAASEFGVLCPAHDLEFLNTLNDIFDCPDDFSEERRHRAEDQQLAIKYPIMNILGGTQPGFLSELLPEQAWSMGFTSRLLMIYSATPVKVSLFGMGNREEKAKHKSEYESRRKALEQDLSTITRVYGEIEFSSEATSAFKTWFEAGLPPIPENSRMQHYNTRRLLYVFKLCMISTLSRGNDLTVSHDDLVRAQDWLLEAESKMPDIFRDMAGKSDKVVIDDLHDFMWKMYTRDKKPLHESKLIMFLKGKVPTEKVFRILELCERSGVIERDRTQALPLYKPGSREMMRDVE